MNIFKDIPGLEKELDQVGEKARSLAYDPLGRQPLSEIVETILSAPGKMLRPALTLIFGRFGPNYPICSVKLADAGAIGGGFLYTNTDSISLGIVATVVDVEYSETSVVEMLDRFKENKLIAPLIEGGELLEYSAHLVPEGGYDAMPELYGDGVLVAGDAAGMVLNLGYMVRGMDLAIEAGRQAANTVLYARRRGDYSRKTLSAYKTALENSCVLRDMKLYRKAPEFMENRRVSTRFPIMLEDIMRAMFTVDGEDSEGLVKKILPTVSDAGITALAKDAIQIVSAL